MDAFMGMSFVAFFFIIFAILILPMVFFLLAQQRALSKCSPANRTMTPGLVWLQIVPFFGFIWQFFVVLALANSLENEFAARRIPEERKPGQSIGLAMCITRVCTVIPFLGIFAAIASFVLWIVYWVKIAGFSRKLDFAPAPPLSPLPYGGGYLGPQTTGGAPYLGATAQQQLGSPGTAQIPAAAAAPLAGEQALTSADAAPEGGPPELAIQSLAPPKDCANCEARIPADATFCAWCGAKVDGDAGS